MESESKTIIRKYADGNCKAGFAKCTFKISSLRTRRMCAIALYKLTGALPRYIYVLDEVLAKISIKTVPKNQAKLVQFMDVGTTVGQNSKEPVFCERV